MNAHTADPRTARSIRPRIGLRWECNACGSHGGAPGVCRLCGEGTMRAMLSTCAPIPFAGRQRSIDR